MSDFTVQFEELAQVKAQLSTALSESDHYRESLEKIDELYMVFPMLMETHIYEIHRIARQALDREPEEPVTREVTREELAKSLDEAWESFKLDSTKPDPQTQDDVDESNAEFDLFVADHLLTTFLIVERRG